MNKLDLHGIRHEEAKNKVIHFLEDNWGTNKEVEVITGCSDRMIQIVATIVDEYNLDYRIGNISDLVKSRVIINME